MKSKRILSPVLALLIVAGMLVLPATPAAAENIAVDVLVPPTLKFDQVYPFSDGYAKVTMLGSDAGPQFGSSISPHGFVDRTGTAVIPIEQMYSIYPLPFPEGFAVIEDPNGRDYRFCIVDNSGKVVTEINNNYSDIGEFSEDMAAVVWRDRWGFIDKTGAEVIPTIYRRVGPFSEGLALATTEDGQSVYLDKTGNRVITLDNKISDSGFSRASFSDGRALIERDGKLGYIDKNGTVVIPIAYDWARPFSGGMAQVELNGKYGVINTSGSVVVPLKCDDIRYFSEGIIAVRIDKKWGFIDKAGKEIVAPKYDLALDFSEGMAEVRLGDKSGFVDKTGKEVIAPNHYDGVGRFSEGLARVRIGEKFGFIDKTGAVVIPIQYAVVGNFSNGLATARFNSKGPGQVGIIDKTGRVVVPFEYDEIRDFSDGLAWARKNGRWGILAIRETGQTATQPPSPPAPPAPPPLSLIVKPTSSTVYINGAATQFEAYNIGGNNYFKLRDLAFAVSGTEKQFEVGWDEPTRAITLTSSKPYTIIGGEMAPGNGREKTATQNTTINILKDGSPVTITAYLIDGNNFVKLRDVMRLFDIHAGYDETTRNITVDTSIPYSE